MSPRAVTREEQSVKYWPTAKARELLDAEITEAELQALIVEAAKAFGWLSYHTHNSRHSAAGFPDLVLVRTGELLFVELKSAKGKLTAAQSEWLNALDGATTVEANVWRPRDLTDALSRLARR